MPRKNTRTGAPAQAARPLPRSGPAGRTAPPAGPGTGTGPALAPREGVSADALRRSAASPRRPKGKPSDRVRSVRCPDEIWELARQRADGEGATVSYAIKMFLDCYGSGMLDLPRVVMSVDRAGE